MMTNEELLRSVRDEIALAVAMAEQRAIDLSSEASRLRWRQLRDMLDGLDRLIDGAS